METPEPQDVAETHRPTAAERNCPPRVPPEMKARIRRAIAQNLREDGGDWDLVREDPEFAPYIGRAAGEAGRKMFFRWKRQLALPLQPDRTRPKDGRQVIEEHQAWADKEASATPARTGLPIRLTGAQLMAQGRTALRGYQMVAERLQQASDDIERIRQCALIEDPEGVKGLAASDPQLLISAVKLEHDNAQRLTAFLVQITKLQDSEEFVQAVVAVIETELADVPEHRERVAAGLERILERYQGPR
jgi:hypothetical protein